MALFDCTECGSQVSDKAAACPKCGAPVVSSAATRPNTAPAAISPAVPPPAAPAPIVVAPTAQLQRKPAITRGRIAAWVFIAFGVWLIFKISSGSSLAGAVRGPQVIVNEKVQLKEGAAVGYGFSLPTSRRVEVEISASPKNVNVMLMSESDWANYQRVKGRLFGGQYQYRAALSRENVLTWSGSEILPEGTWRIVVERPREAILFGDATNASIKIIGN